MNQKKILLIEYAATEEVSFSIGVLNIATILNEEGYAIKIMNIDQQFKDGIIELSKDIAYKLKEKIMEEKPVLVGFNCMCNNYHIFLKTAKLIKESEVGIKVMFGGPQATLTAEETMVNFDCVDLISVGEAENTILGIVRFLMNEKESIPNNIYYRSNGKVIKSEKKIMMSDLDKLPLINYNLIPHFDKVDIIPIEVGRGCPYCCTFCSTNIFWERKTRYKSIERITREIERLIRKGKFKFNFVHDLFTADRKFINMFCQKMIDRDIRIEWICSARVDTIDDTLLSLMKKAGCVGIFFGIETGSLKMQREIKKNLSIQNIDNLLKSLLKNEYKNSTFSFIYGFPNEREEDLSKSLDLIKKINYEYGFKTMLTKCTILPKTELYYELFDCLKFDRDYSNISGNIDLLEFEDMFVSNKEIFPFFYSFNSQTLNNFKGLENFFVCYTVMKNLFKNSFSLIDSRFNGDILKFYKEVYPKLEEEFLEIADYYSVYRQIITKKEYDFFFQRINSLLLKISDIIISSEEKEIKLFFHEVFHLELHLRLIKQGVVQKMEYGNNILMYMKERGNIKLYLNIPIYIIISKEKKVVKMKGIIKNEKTG